MLRISFIFLILFSSISNLLAANSLSYSGRLVQASGAPVTGPVNLRAELVYTNATSTVQCSQNLTSVALTKGVFHLKLDFNCTPKTLNQVLSETPNGESVAIRIIDQTNSKTYPLQAIHSVPFSKMAEQLPQMGASAGQALAWDGAKWAPTSVGTGNGTVMSVTAGTGLSGGTITTTGTIGIAAGGITSTELANNAVTATKINAGEITSSHISATANIPYSKLSILDGEIPAVKINGLQSEIDNIISSVITNGDTTHAPSGDAVHDALTLKFDKAGGALTPGSTITGLPTLPLVGSEATSKDYVDNKVGALTTTSVAEGTNYYFTEPRVLATPLTGVNVSEAGTIAASDSVLQAFGKTQKQISDITSTITGNQWAVSGSDVYRASGKVGIGTNTPQNALDVRGTITSSSGSTWGSGANSQFKAIDSNGLLFSLGLDAGNSKLELNTQYWSMPIVFSVNNSEKMRILNNGNVGIGTAAPGEKLEVSGNIKANQLCIGADCRGAWPSVGSGSVTTTEIADGTIQTADIGNSQVSYAKLNLTDGDIPLAKLDGASDVSKYLRGDKTWSTFATDAINSVLSTFTLGTGTKPSVSNTDTVVGAFGKVQKSLNDINADYVSKTADQVIFGSLAINSTTGFITVPNPINPNDAANKAYVDGFGQWLENGSNIYFNTGNVGIGTNIPSQKLSVSDSMAITNSAGVQYLLIGNQDSSGVNHPSIIRAGNGNLEIGTGTSWSGTGGTFNSKVYFADSGNVGVGSTNPTERLDVTGNGKFSGSVTAASFSGNGSGLTNISSTSHNHLFDYGSGYSGGLVPFSLANAGVNAFQDYTGTALGIGSTFWAGVTAQNSNSGAQFALNWNAETGSTSGFKVRVKDDNQATWGTWRGVAFEDTTVAKAGSTMTGTLNLPANGLNVGSGQIIATGGNVGIGTSTPSEPLHILKNDGVANGEHWLFRAEKSAAEGGVVIGYEADGTNFVAAKVRSSSNADLIFGTTGFMNMLTLKNNGTANFRGNNIPRFNPSMGMQLGDQDWTDFISQLSGTLSYSSADKGIKTTGDTFFILNSRIPIDPLGVYRVTARIKKIDGTGTVYVGADSLDSNFNTIKTDAENSYNYFAAEQVTVAPGSTYVASGTISGHNIVGGTGDDRFDPNAKYFNVIIITNYLGTGNSVIESVEIHKLPTLEPWRIPTFENSWTNYGNSYGTAAYFKDNSGIVHIRGMIMGGTINTCAFTLPVGYRPAFRILRATQTHNNALGRVDIQSNGCVTPVVGDAIWFSLDGINFRTD